MLRESDTAQLVNSTRSSSIYRTPRHAGAVALRNEERSQSTPVRNAIQSDTTASSDGVRIVEALPLAPLQLAQYRQVALGSRLEVLQSWEGVVLDVDDQAGTFRARLHDLTTKGANDAEADLDIRDVSENDIDLLREGGVFRWLIGYRKHKYGQMDRVSAIIFRRLPSWDEGDLKSALAEGDRLAAAFTFE